MHWVCWGEVGRMRESRCKNDSDMLILKVQLSRTQLCSIPITIMLK